MWIISKEYGAFNTDNISAIRHPDVLSDEKFVLGYDGQCGHRITSGLDNYHKIINGLKNNDYLVEVD